MKKLFLYAAALLAAVSFSACSDDDENTLNPSMKNIAGTWMLILDEGWYHDSEEDEEWSDSYPDEYGGYLTATFNTDGTYIETEYEYGEDPNPSIEPGTYSISGNTLTVTKTYDDSDTESYTHIIKKLTESELVVTVSERDDSEDWRFEQKYVFKRID